MSRTNTLFLVAMTLLGMAVAAFAAINLVVGHRYTLTGTMSQCHEHPGTFFLDVTAEGGSGGGGSHSARHGNEHEASGRLMLQPATPQVNLDAVFTTLHQGQRVTATGVYVGLVGSGSARETHPTLRTEQLSAGSTSAREAKFDDLYQLRRR